MNSKLYFLSNILSEIQPWQTTFHLVFISNTGSEVIQALKIMFTKLSDYHR